ncbi:MAG: MBL fold metallo-hydrolase [Deltaproteobacteria bacterium]|nr:MBL fold metallo-hydrolase [Deltaproteobacteria bacterium]
MKLLSSGLLTALLATACSSSPPPAPPPQATATPVEPAPTAKVEAPPAPGPITIDVFTAPEEAGAVNSVIVQNDRELIVIDGQLVVPVTQALVDKIKASKKTPNAFFLTHAHPDHYFGFYVLQQAFPGVPLYATAGVKAEFEGAAKPTLEGMKGMLGAGAPADVAKVTLLEGALELGGEKLEVSELKGGEHGLSAIVSVPSLKAVIAGDNLYSNVHNWMKECDAATWIGHLETWKKNDPATVYYPGHGAGKGGAELLDANIAYLPRASRPRPRRSRARTRRRASRTRRSSCSPSSRATRRSSSSTGRWPTTSSARSPRRARLRSLRARRRGPRSEPWRATRVSA